MPSTLRATLFVAVMVMIASCGGSNAGSDVSTSEAGESTPPGDNTTTTSPVPVPDDTGGTSDDSDASPASAGSSATVTIEGETYYFADVGPAVQCEPDFFGVFMAALVMVDEDGAEIPGGGGSLRGALLHEGTDPDTVGQLNELGVSIEALDQEWVADEEDIQPFGLDPGSSQVDSHSIDGSTVSGTATFYEVNSYYAVTGGTADSVTVAQGTFEIICTDS